MQAFIYNNNILHFLLVQITKEKKDTLFYKYVEVNLFQSNSKIFKKQLRSCLNSLAIFFLRLSIFVVKNPLNKPHKNPLKAIIYYQNFIILDISFHNHFSYIKHELKLQKIDMLQKDYIRLDFVETQISDGRSRAILRPKSVD